MERVAGGVQHHHRLLASLRKQLDQQNAHLEEVCYRFWAIFCKNGSPYAIGPLSVLSSLSVTLVYCGQTVGWIKMKLGVEVGLDPGHIVLDGDPAPPPQKVYGPNSRPMSVVAKRLDGSRCHLVCMYTSAQVTLC